VTVAGQGELKETDAGKKYLSFQAKDEVRKPEFMTNFYNC
jgi:hypothetical protein